MGYTFKSGEVVSEDMKGSDCSGDGVVFGMVTEILLDGWVEVTEGAKMDIVSFHEASKINIEYGGG
jgi:hypothetical protein